MEWSLTDGSAKRLGRTYGIDGTLWLSYSASGAEWICRDAECTIRLTGDAMSGDPVHSPRYAIEVNGRRVVNATMPAGGEAVHTVSAAGEKPVHRFAHCHAPFAMRHRYRRNGRNRHLAQKLVVVDAQHRDVFRHAH